MRCAWQVARKFGLGALGALKKERPSFLLFSGLIRQNPKCLDSQVKEIIHGNHALHAMWYES